MSGARAESPAVPRLRRWAGGVLAEWERPEPFDWRAALACLLGGLALWPLVARLPVLGFDWLKYFVGGDFSPYPPWAEWLLAPLTALPWRAGLGLVNSLTLMTVAVAAARECRAGRADRLGAALLALLSPPTLFLLWVGNVDGLALLGYVAMPAGVALALLKPHLMAWAMLARRRWLLWAAALALLATAIWGAWPVRLLATVGLRQGHPMAMGWASLGWPVALVGLGLLPFSGADPLRLMAAGAFLSPFLMPVHFVLLTPALGRVSGRRRLLVWGGLWLTALPAMFMGAARYVALLCPLLVWWALRGER